MMRLLCRVLGHKPFDLLVLVRGVKYTELGTERDGAICMRCGEHLP